MHIRMHIRMIAAWKQHKFTTGLDGSIPVDNL